MRNGNDAQALIHVWNPENEKSGTEVALKIPKIRISESLGMQQDIFLK